MRGKKSPMIMGLIGAMLLSTNAFAAVPSDFSDFPTDWSAPAMTHAVQNGLLNGSDGKILPKGLLTRAQMATMVNRAFASSAKASLTSFTDMVPGAWHYNEMAKAVQMGVFQGADGKLSPDDPITREQAFAVLARAFGLADGRAAALNKFSDGAQISSWAKGAVAALVEQGYVTGADGALNPQSNITRAEFAQVMDALVAAYGDQGLKDQTVDGNLILRANGTLENVTVKGDLILADGVSAASLKNVTVTGRLVVRGGTDGVKLIKSTAKGGIRLANPNGTPKVTVDGKAYIPTGLPGSSNSGGGSPSGGSSGGSSSSSGGGSSSGGNSSTTQGTIVKADKTKVIATDAGTWLPLVFETGYNKGNTTVTVDGKDVTTYVTNVTTEGTIAKLPLVGQPGTVTLTSGGKTQTITIGTAPTSGSAVYTGADYLPDYYLGHTSLALWDYYLTNYDDEGNARVLPKQTTFSTTPAKNEHPSYSPVTKLNENNTSGNVVIMFNYKNSAAKDGDEEWFDNIADTGALELVQYDQYKTVLNNHLTYTKDTTDHNGKVGTLTIPFNQDNFRNNGRYYVRVASTTADGKKSYALVPIHVVNHDAPEFAVKETPESGRNLHFSVKNMVYGIVDPIEEVTLTKPDKTTVTLNKIDDYFLFSQDLFVLYNDTSAENGTNHLDQKGTYVLTIKANGFQDATCKFYVADGKEVETPVTKAMRSYGIDVLSGSSTSIGGSDSSSSGGGYAVSADLLFDSDLLANALVLEKVGAETSAASTVLDYWKTSVIADSVFNTGDTKYYTFSNYISAVNTAQAEGTMWIPFTSYHTDAQATASQPRATKAVLEDGLLGDLQDSSSSGKLDYVKATVSSNQENSDVMLTFTGEKAEDYLNKITSQGLIYLNGDWRELDANYYTIKNNTITFQARCFKVGSNTIQLKAAGYKVQDVEVNYAKVNETDLSLTATVDEETAGKVHIVVNNSNGDFLKNLKSITLTKGDEVDVVLAKGVEGSNAVYYVVAKDYKSVDLYNVTTPGQYTVNIKANYYEEAGLSAEFTVAGTVELKPVPNAKPTGSISDNVYTLDFGNLGYNSWKSDISVEVNGSSYKLNDFVYKLSMINPDEFAWYDPSYNSSILNLGKSAFKNSGKNTVVISASGYETLTLIVNGSDGSVVVNGGTTDPVTPPETETKDAPTAAGVEKLDTDTYRVTFEGMDGTALKAYLGNISSVKVGDNRYSKASFWWNVNLSYKPDVVDSSSSISDYDCLKLTTDGFSTEGNTVVTIKVDGYADLIFTVSKEGKLVTDSNPGENPGGGNTGENPGGGEIAAPTVAPTIEYTQATSGNYNSYYKLTFQGDDSAWINTITAVSVDGTSYTKKDSAGELSFSQNYYLDAENSIVGITLSSGTREVVFSVNEKTSLTLEISAPFLGTPSVTIKSTETPGSGENGGSTGGNETPNPGAGENAVPTEVSIEKLTDTKSYRDYYALTFGSAYKEWVSSITAIKVGETAYTKVDSTDELNVQTYYLGDDGTMGIYLTGGFSDTTYQLTCITEENTTITIVVVIPSLFSDTTLSATIQ